MQNITNLKTRVYSFPDNVVTISNRPKISIAIPYHQTEKTAFFLHRLLKTIDRQSFRNYEIILTSDGQFAENHNSAIKKAQGEIIQMIQMDDYFTHKDSLKNIVNAFEQNPDKAWAITSCMHYYNETGSEANHHIPQWTDDIYKGNNRLGSVSTLSMRREKALLFEEPLTWLVDCHLYYRLYQKYGEPIYIQTPNVSIDTRIDRLTYTIPNEIKQAELEYMLKLFSK